MWKAVPKSSVEVGMNSVALTPDSRRTNARSASAASGLRLVSASESPVDALPDFSAIVSRTRREQVADVLREAILSGQLVQGAQLVEMKVAARLGVSRGSVREAIRELVEQGLLVSKPYGGTYVASVTERGMVELFDLRKVLERHAFRLVWPHRTATYRREFTRRHDALIAAAEEGGMSAEIRAEMHFHSTCYEFSGNSLLIEMWQMLVQRIRLGFVISQTIDRRRSFKAANARYLRCALGDDLDAMLAEADRHIEMGLSRVRRFLRRADGASTSESSEDA
jgi:DNA-binding GntR family transcriptional regulator